MLQSMSPLFPQSAWPTRLQLCLIRARLANKTSSSQPPSNIISILVFYFISILFYQYSILLVFYFISKMY